MITSISCTTQTKNAPPVARCALALRMTGKKHAAHNLGV